MLNSKKKNILKYSINSKKYFYKNYRSELINKKFYNIFNEII